jgi:formamidopyrimidine-DNA glycosylase
MPELPEVETTRKGIAGCVVGQKVVSLKIHQAQLRWPVEVEQLSASIVNRPFTHISRRGKYLIFNNDIGAMLCHLGMSGSLRIVTELQARRKHDHVEWWLENGAVMRFHDPRRFGCVLWIKSDPNDHRLLRYLGPEPLSKSFNGTYLYQKARGRKQSVKQFIMNSQVVVGVGNIYASEALFLAGIHPSRQAGRISPARCELLVDAIKLTLKSAIKSGGTTLRDFVNSQGQPGYFRQKLNVYEKPGLPCCRCTGPIKRIIQGQRASYYCPGCQT